MNSLKVDKCKNFNKGNYIVIGAGLSVSLLSLYLYVQAKNNNFLNNNLKNDSKNNLAILVDGVKQNEFPEKGSGYAFDSVVCKNGSTGTWDSDGWKLLMNFSGSDSCVVSFRKSIKIVSVSVSQKYDYANSNWYVENIVLSDNSAVVKFDFKVNDGEWETYGYSDTEIMLNTCTVVPNTYKYYIRAYNKDGVVSEIFESSLSACFIAGTKIWVSNGYKNIEKINIGDLVYSYNETNKCVELKKVTNFFEHIDSNIYIVKAGNEIIKVTSMHRFYSKRKNSEIYEWIAIKDLQVGDYLCLEGNSIIAIDSITLKREINKVYNIAVDVNHNYFVTKSKVLVHNVKLPCAL